MYIFIKLYFINVYFYQISIPPNTINVSDQKVNAKHEN